MGTKKLALPWQILIGIVLGVLFGIFLFDYVKYVEWMGTLFLRALKMIIIPLVFSTLIIGVASMGKSSDLGRIAGKTLLFYLCTTIVAILIGVVLVNIFKPGVGASLPVAEQVSGVAADADFVNMLINIVPANVFEDMAKGNLLPVIFFAIIFGIFITKSKDKNSETLLSFFNAVFEVIMKMTMFIISFAPFGIFAIVASMIAKEAGDLGKLGGILSSLGFYTAIVWIGCLIQGFIVLPACVYFLGKENPWRFIQKMSSPILTAFSTCSSGAALPIAMRDIEQKCGVSNKIAGFALPLGATINMNGTALYEGVTVLFIAQVYGVDLSIAQQFLVVGTVMLAAVGAAGIPMAGIVMLSVVLTVVGLPLEGVGLVLAVQQLCDMPRTAVNSFGDQCAAVVVAKSEGESLTI